MPRNYTPKPKVICHSCGDEMTKRRNSLSGVYYCPKNDCQTARRGAWFSERATARERELLDEREKRSINSAAFLSAALRGERVKCPSCGLVNALPGYPHLLEDGTGCGGTGGPVDGVSIHHALAAWPDGTRVYA